MPTAGHSGTKIINDKENYHNIHVFEGLKLFLTILKISLVNARDDILGVWHH